MTLLELAQSVAEALHACKSAGGKPGETDAVVATPDGDLWPISTSLEEVPDDEETYREHLRVGGAREFTFQIRTK